MKQQYSPDRNRRDVIEFERLTGGDTPFDDEAATWTSLGTRRGRVTERLGRESLEAGALTSHGTATVRVPADELTRGITIEDRVRARNQLWNIRAISVLDERQRFISFLVEKGRAV